VIKECDNEMLLEEEQSYLDELGAQDFINKLIEILIKFATMFQL
jgi:hypothetical protein